MAQVIAITNQKGGVGKTTTALNLGAGLTRQGKRVLFVDLDPQCSLTYALRGMDGPGTVQEALLGQKSAQDALTSTDEGDLIPASPALSSMDMMLTQTGKEFRLREALAPIRENYDFIILDGPPALGVLTVNILTAADRVIIPALADIFSLQGIGQLYATIEAVRTYCNRDLTVGGILLTRHNDRYVLSREMRELMQETAAQLHTIVFEHTVREAVALREAEATQQSIFAYAPKSKQAGDYAAWIGEFLNSLSTGGGEANGEQ